MAFPQTPLPLNIELLLGSTWTSITALGHVQRRDGMVTVTRGRSAEAGDVDASRLTATINNRDGRYSPRNPISPYYGILGRNTQIRASLTGSSSYLALDGTTGRRITTPDHASLDITGDIDVRLEVTLGSWRREQDLAGKYDTSSQRSWTWWLNHDGVLSFSWSTDGGNINLSTRNSTVPVPAPASGRQALRVTLDVNNGAGGHTVVFYTAPSMDGPWAQLGDPVVTSGTTSIFASTAALELGMVEDLVTGAMAGQVHRFEVRNGIGGTVVAGPDFRNLAAGTTSFADSAGRTWTVQNGAEITNKVYRFWGEVSAWPSRWDKTGTDVYVPIEAAGIMRRLGQARVDGSAMYRAILRDTAALVAYWPLEDEQGAQLAGPGLATHGGMTFTGSPEFAAFEGFACSLPIVTLNGASFTGSVPSYDTSGGLIQIRFLMNVPAAGAENGEVIMMLYGTGTVRRWELFYGTGGTLGLRGFDSGGTQLFTTGNITFNVNGELLRVSIELDQFGADIDYSISTLEPGATVGGTFNGTLAGNTLGRIGTVTISPGGGIDGISIGHVTVQNAVTTLFDLGAQLAGWKGETAGRRIERLCEEEGIAFRAIGDLDDSTRMGVQAPGAFLDLVRACAQADGGLLYEPRDCFGLGYRTRSSLYNQAARVALSYSGKHLADSLDPVDDDQNVRNDVTVSREGGSSARAVQETGTLSVLAPPNGVGRYDVSETVNVEYDLDLFDQAGWRLHLGTVDEARYPQIHVDLSRPQIAGDSALTQALRLAEVGDRLAITGLPAWLPPEAISQIVVGYSELLGNFEHQLTFNCVPESPYRPGVYGSGNLINNGHFETATTGWVAGANTSIARDTGQAYAGTASLAISRSAASTLHYAEGQDVDGTGTSGDVVTISCYVRIPAASRPKITSIEISATGFATTTVSGIPAADTWTRIAVTGALSADIDNVQVRFQVDNTHSNGQVVAYVDAVQIRNVATEDLVDRYQPHASTLAAGINTTATSLSVATSAGPLWTTDDEEFPFDLMIGGERMTVLDISGSSSPQTFTVIRSVNGVVKSHSSGAQVQLFRVSRYGL
ncbi:carbohydrate binding domain-containing protein [Thermoactinospora rubra]|uniref:carbohydrate binding domain-containing protein n=1 Tax=Thermoactinospora rubra TaxID=1088767 RepID=UPI000A11163A|nr:carbohydrate binding domain-containing protein [Thermoactinospora rubra]